MAALLLFGGRPSDSATAGAKAACPAPPTGAGVSAPYAPAAQPAVAPHAAAAAPHAPAAAPQAISAVVYNQPPSAEGGLLQSSLRNPDGTPLPIQLEIEDDGPGIPPRIADQVFEPFVSGRENGTGLGLALAGKIVTDHGGLIRAESRPGRTVLRVSLPQAGKGGG